MTENEMVGWHHRFRGHELGQIPGESEGQGSLTCCSQWGRKECDTTYQMNNNRRTGSLYTQKLVFLDCSKNRYLKHKDVW